MEVTEVKILGSGIEVKRDDVYGIHDKFLSTVLRRIKHGFNMSISIDTKFFMLYGEYNGPHADMLKTMKELIVQYDMKKEKWYYAGKIDGIIYHIAFNDDEWKYPKPPRESDIGEATFTITKYFK